MAVLEFGDTFDGYTKSASEAFSASLLGKKWQQAVDDNAGAWTVLSVVSATGPCGSDRPATL